MKDFRSIFKEALELKLKSNPNLSISSLSKKIGLSKSTVSEYLKDKHSLSIVNIIKVIKWIATNKDEEEFLFFSALSGYSKNPLFLNLVNEKLDYWEKGQLFENRKDLQKFIKNTCIDEQYYYIKTQLNDDTKHLPSLRVLTTLKCTKTGKKLPHFQDYVIHLKTLLCGGGYFIQNPDASYCNYQYFNFNFANSGIVLDERNKKLRVDFEDGLPRIQSVASKNLKTNEIKYLNFTFGPDDFSLTECENTQEARLKETYIRFTPSKKEGD